MINAINDLRRKWRERQERLGKDLMLRNCPDRWHDSVSGKCQALEECIGELIATVDGVKPRPLNEASTEKLYKWAGRMVRIMDLMVASRDKNDAFESPELAELATQDFLNDIYDLFKQLANRQSGA